MNKEEIQKQLIKQNPEADFVKMNKHGMHYVAYIFSTPGAGRKQLFFNIPSKELTAGEFLPTMPAKLLIRYLQEEDDTLT